MTGVERAIAQARIQAGLYSRRALVAERRRAMREAQLAVVAAVLSMAGLVVLSILVSQH